MIMDFSLAFEAFMVFYLIQVIFLAVFAWMLAREYQIEDQAQALQARAPTGPSPSEIIKMRAKVREIQRQQQ